MYDTVGIMNGTGLSGVSAEYILYRTHTATADSTQKSTSNHLTFPLSALIMKIDPLEMHYVHCPPPTPQYIIQIRAAGLTKWATIYSANAHTPAPAHLATIFKNVPKPVRNQHLICIQALHASFMHEIATRRNFKLQEEIGFIDTL